MRRCHFRLLIVCVFACHMLLPYIGMATAGQAADQINANRYPNVHQFFSSIDFNVLKREAVFRADRWWCPAEVYIAPPQETIEAVLRAAVSDELTAMRWLALMSKVLHAEGLAMCSSGDPLNAAIELLNLDLGLALPLRELGAFAWIPHRDLADPTKLMQLNLIYRKQYVHRFRKEILPVDLKIGYGKIVRFIDNGRERNGYLTSMDFYVSHNRIGFENIKGLAARQQGLIGLLQRFFFFLPDGVGGMYVENNDLVAKSLVTIRVPNFETTSKYQMRIRAQEMKVSW